jgi:hypothetical protein
MLQSTTNFRIMGNGYQRSNEENFRPFLILDANRKPLRGVTRSVHTVCVFILSYIYIYIHIWRTDIWTAPKHSGWHGGWWCKEVSVPQTVRLFYSEPRNPIIDLLSLETSELQCSFGQITVRWHAVCTVCDCGELQWRLLSFFAIHDAKLKHCFV